jgi:hypothetical protein
VAQIDHFERRIFIASVCLDELHVAAEPPAAQPIIKIKRSRRRPAANFGHAGIVAETTIPRRWRGARTLTGAFFILLGAPFDKLRAGATPVALFGTANSCPELAEGPALTHASSERATPVALMRAQDRRCVHGGAQWEDVTNFYGIGLIDYPSERDPPRRE